MEKQKQRAGGMPRLVGQAGADSGQRLVGEIDRDLDGHVIEAGERDSNAQPLSRRAGPFIFDWPVVASRKALDDLPAVEEVRLALAAVALGEEHPDGPEVVAGRIDRHDFHAFVHRMVRQPDEPVVIPVMVSGHQRHDRCGRVGRRDRTDQTRQSDHAGKQPEDRGRGRPKE